MGAGGDGGGVSSSDGSRGCVQLGPPSLVLLICLFGDCCVCFSSGFPIKDRFGGSVPAMFYM